MNSLRFWMVLGEGTPCYRHLTRASACTEAERLARLAPNQEFVVLEAIAIVKKSDAGICHDKSSPSFEKTQKFTAFKSVEECVKSGGTLPKK